MARQETGPMTSLKQHLHQEDPMEPGVPSVKASMRGRVCHLGSDDRVVLMCAELDEQSAQRCKT